MSATALIRRRIVSPTKGLNPMGENTADFAINLTQRKGNELFYMDDVAVSAGCSERVSALNSLIPGKIQGIFVEAPYPPA